MIKKIEILKYHAKGEISGIAGAEQLRARLTDQDGHSIIFDILNSNLVTDRTSFMTKVDLTMQNGKMHIDDAEVLIITEEPHS